MQLNESGDEIAQIDTWLESIYSGGSKPQARIVDFAITDLTGNGERSLVVLSDDVYWYASRLMVLKFAREEFQLSNVYWNPGLLYTMTITDLNKDSLQEIIVTGVNNDLQAVIPLGGNVNIAFLLEGNYIEGEAPPWFGGTTKGSEIWYAYFEPSEVRIVQTFTDEDLDNDGSIDIQFALEDGCSFYVNMEGSVIGYGHGTVCQGVSEIRFYP